MLYWVLHHGIYKDSHTLGFCRSVGQLQSNSGKFATMLLNQRRFCITIHRYRQLYCFPHQSLQYIVVYYCSIQYIDNIGLIRLLNTLPHRMVTSTELRVVKFYVGPAKMASFVNHKCTQVKSIGNSQCMHTCIHTQTNRQNTRD